MGLGMKRNLSASGHFIIRVRADGQRYTDFGLENNIITSGYRDIDFGHDDKIYTTDNFFSNNLNKFKVNKFPNTAAYESLKLRSHSNIDYCSYPLDALQMNNDIYGCRTMFSAIHHFEQEEVALILRNNLKGKNAIGIFDSGDKHIGTIAGILLFHPILFFLCTLIIRPFKLNRIIFTYLIPIIPIYTIWDGVVSILRLYGPDELMEIAKHEDKTSLYDWTAGKNKNKIGLSVTYLIGSPKQSIIEDT